MVIREDFRLAKHLIERKRRGEKLSGLLSGSQTGSKQNMHVCVEMTEMAFRDRWTYPRDLETMISALVRLISSFHVFVVCNFLFRLRIIQCEMFGGCNYFSLPV